MPADADPLQAALQLHKANRLAEAEQLYRQFLQANPQHPGALHFLGTLLGQIGRLDESIGVLKQVLGLRPDFPECHNNCGLFLLEKGQSNEAMSHFQSAIRLKPDFSAAYVNLARALKQAHRVQESIAVYREGLKVNPADPLVHFGLALALQETGLLEPAVASYRQAIALQPHFAQAWSNLGNTFQLLGRREDAMAAYQQAIGIDPTYADAHNNLGNMLLAQGQPDAAAACYRLAIKYQPGHADAYNNLGTALREIGQIEQALDAYREAAALRPHDASIASNVVFCLNFRPTSTQATIAAEAAEWSRRHAQPLVSSIRAPTNDRNPHRRLRIGYISPDFRLHPVALFMKPLLDHHNPEAMEVFCYSDVRRPDEVTQGLRASGHTWRQIAWENDSRVAEIIRGDGIDILVDLAMHTAHNRLAVFARRPAPVQVAYLAYPGTTGLTTIDYRLSDPFLDPPDSNLSGYSEATMRLPQTFWCYAPGEALPVNELPAARLGYVTFGSLNIFPKVSDQALAAWAELLQMVPRSRLIMHAPAGSARDRATRVLQRHGLDAERCQFVARVPCTDYLAEYHHIDISLDSFPHAGGTTTFDSLWMGVPVVTLAGQLAVQRGGVSILTNLGLPELIARTPAEYVRIAGHLAGDIPRLAILRANLRQRMGQSALMDRPRFTRAVEEAYRQMWQNWCVRGSSAI